MRDTHLSQLPTLTEADLQEVTGGAGLLGGLLSNLFKGGRLKGLLGACGGGAGGGGEGQAPQAGGGGGG
jgi:hypothetical protein